MGISLSGAWAGVVVAGLALLLLLAPPGWLYRTRSPVIRSRRSEPVPRWATIFFRLLGLVLLALAAALMWPTLQGV